MVLSSLMLFRSFRRLSTPLDGFTPHVIGEPHRIGPESSLAVGGNARTGAARRQTKHVYRHRHAAGVAIADLDVAIDHHGRADEAHRAHADAVAELLEFLFQ